MPITTTTTTTTSTTTTTTTILPSCDEPSLLWSKTLGRKSNTERGFDITIDNENSYFVVGYTDRGGTSDSALLKFDSDGVLLWNKFFGDTEYDYPTRVRIDGEGNIVVAGRKYVDSHFDVWLVKFDGDGNLIWENNWNGIKTDYSRGLAIDSDDNYIVSGETFEYPGSVMEGVLLKYDESGSLVWERMRTSGCGSSDQSVQVDSDGNYLVAGYVRHKTVYGDCGYSRVLLMKYDRDGNFIWEKLWGGNEDLIYAFDASIDKDGNYVVTGNLKNNQNNRDVFVAKFDANGNYIWHRTWDVGEDYGFKVIVDSQNNYVITGFRKLADDMKSILLKYDSDGNLLFEDSWSIEEHESSGYGLTQDLFGDYIITGELKKKGKNGDLMLLKYGCNETTTTTTTTTTSSTTTTTIPSTSTTTATLPSSDWELISPGTLGFAPTVVADPFNANMVYTGINCGGVGRSSNRGDSWEYIMDGFDFKTYGDAADNTNIIGAHPRIEGLVLLGGPLGIYKSTDRGDHWNLEYIISDDPNVRGQIESFVFDPVNDNIIFAGNGRMDSNQPTKHIWPSSGALLYSDNYGESWSMRYRFTSDDVEYVHVYYLAMASSNIMYAATNIGLWKSVDAGLSWSKINGLPHDNTVTVVVDLSDPSGKTVYVTLATKPRPEYQDWNGGIWKSTDSGKSWSEMNDDLLKTFECEVDSKHELCNSNYLELEINSDGVLYLGNIGTKGAGVYKSGDGGVSWDRIADKEKVPLGWNRRAVTGAEISISPIDSNLIYFISNRDMAYRSDNNGQDWKMIYTQEADGSESSDWSHRGFDTKKSVILVDPQDNNKIILTPGDKWPFTSDDGGKTFTYHFSGKKGDDNHYGIFDTNSDNVYILGEAHIMHSGDRGRSWELVEDGLPEAKTLSRIAINPRDSSELYMTAYGSGVYKSTDYGQSWRKKWSKSNTDVNALLIHNNIIYVGVDKKSGGLVYRSTDWGESWEKIFIGLSQNINHFTVFKNSIYAATSDGVYRSGDGTGWTKVIEGEEMMQVEPSPGGDFIAAVGRREGVSYSTDGIQWADFNAGLVSIDLWHLAIDSGDNVYVSARCVGTWKKKIV